MPSTASPAAVSCPRCGRVPETADLACALCGEVLRREVRPPPREGLPHPGGPSGGAGDRTTAEAPERVLGLPAAWGVLLAGALLAPVLTWTPLLRYVGWFLTSLVHETGHAAVAWALGCPAYPAIRLDGHAVAVHREQVPFLCFAVLAGVAALAWTWRRRPALLASALVALPLYALFAFVPRAREGAFLFAGHGGEIAFATYALVRAVDGGFTGSLAERLAHAAVGAYLVGRDLVLSVGLVTSDAARTFYLGNGSLGLENDLVRLARTVLRTSLATTSLLLVAASLIPVVVVVLRASRPAR